MRKILLASMLGLFFIGCGTQIRYFDIQGALDDPKAKAVLGDDIEIFFGRIEMQKTSKTHIIHTNKRTTLSGKSSIESACRWALYSAIKQLQLNARKKGKTKVINIVGNWKHIPYNNTEKFQCALSNFLAGVALQGEIEE